MPRQARKRCVRSTGFHHVVIRGNNKKYIYNDKRHKQDFYEFLAEQEQIGRIELVAWCINSRVKSEKVLRVVVLVLHPSRE